MLCGVTRSNGSRVYHRNNVLSSESSGDFHRVRDADRPPCIHDRMPWCGHVVLSMEGTKMLTPPGSFQLIPVPDKSEREHWLCARVLTLVSLVVLKLHKREVFFCCCFHAPDPGLCESRAICSAHNTKLPVRYVHPLSSTLACFVLQFRKQLFCPGRFYHPRPPDRFTFTGDLKFTTVSIPFREGWLAFSRVTLGTPLYS